MGYPPRRQCHFTFENLRLGKNSQIRAVGVSLIQHLENFRFRSGAFDFDQISDFPITR